MLFRVLSASEARAGRWELHEVRSRQPSLPTTRKSELVAFQNEAKYGSRGGTTMPSSKHASVACFAVHVPGIHTARLVDRKRSLQITDSILTRAVYRVADS